MVYFLPQTANGFPQQGVLLFEGEGLLDFRFVESSLFGEDLLVKTFSLGEGFVVMLQSLRIGVPAMKLPAANESRCERPYI